MKNRHYKILKVPIKISSNNSNILDLLDKTYCCFTQESAASQPLLELIVQTNNGTVPNLKNLKIFAVTPHWFDGWDRSSKVWCGKSIVNRYVFEIENPHPIKINKATQKLFEIKTRTKPLGIKAGWLLQLHFHINLFVLDFFRKLFFVHGGALKYKKKGIILAGHSGSGKSTLTYALAKNGFTYLTDESILIDAENFKIMPYPVSPSFEKDSVHLFKEVNLSFKEDKKLHNESVKSFLDIKKIGIITSSSSITPRVIIFPRYTPNKRPHFKPLPKYRALDFLKKNIFSFQEPKKIKTSKSKIAQSLIEKCACYELSSNKLDETVALVKQLLASSKGA